jgi:hypothetical protein
MQNILMNTSQGGVSLRISGRSGASCVATAYGNESICQYPAIASFGTGIDHGIDNRSGIGMRHSILLTKDTCPSLWLSLSRDFPTN